MHLFSSIIYFALTFYIPIGIMITETHIRNLQNPTKFVKIAKNSRNSTITHKSRLLKYKINKSILNQNKCQLTRNKQPPKHTAARRTPESVPSATKRIQNGQSSANHELSSDPLLRKRVRRRRCSADRRLRRSIQTNPVLLLRQQTRPPRSPAKRALSAHGTKTHRKTSPKNCTASRVPSSTEPPKTRNSIC